MEQLEGSEQKLQRISEQFKANPVDSTDPVEPELQMDEETRLKLAEVEKETQE